MKPNRFDAVPVRLCAACLLGAALVVLSACAGSVRQTGFVQSYEPLGENDSKRSVLRVLTDEDDELDRFFLTNAETKRLKEKGKTIPTLSAEGIEEEDVQPIAFIVIRPEWRAEQSLRDEEYHDRLAFVVRERLYRYLLREYPHPVRVRYAWVPGESALEGYRLLEIRTAITDIKRGSGWVRYVIGYGAGAAVLQLEGQIVDITDPEREEVVAEFATRTAHAAYPQGFFNPNVIHDHYALMYAAEAGIRHLTPRLRQEIPAARLRPEAPATAAAAGP